MRGERSYGHSGYPRVPEADSCGEQGSPAAVWITYDDEADTLYINFKKPSHATDSELTDEDVIIRYEGETVIGFTVLHASKRLQKTA